MGFYRSPGAVRAGPQARPVTELRVCWTDDLGSVPVSDEVLGAMRRFTYALAKSGCKVERAEPKDFDVQEIWRTYGRISDMELASLTPQWLRFTTHFFGKSFRKDVPFVQSVYPATFGKYMYALSRRDGFAASLKAFFGDWDVWLCPVSSTPAFSHIEPKRYISAFPIYDRPLPVDGARSITGSPTAPARSFSILPEARWWLSPSGTQPADSRSAFR